uniref:Large ribosomal subunit protein uL10m n=1 Tax=Triatoma infestans TaxID=30076 RepID=A0A023F7D4_TRIIF
MSVGAVRDCLLRLKWSPALCTQRFKRINVQRPRAPHYERAKVLALLKPQYKEDPSLYLLPALKCRKQEELKQQLIRVENPLEKIIAKEMLERFQNSKLVAFLHANPICGEDEFQAKVKLKREKMDIQIYSKYTAKLALEGTRFEAVLQLFVAHNALVFCDEPKVEVLMKTLKKIPQYILMAAIVDNRILSLSQLEKYVQLKDLSTARAHFVAQLNSVANNVVTQLNQHQTTLVTRLQQIADAKADSGQNETS